jgi:hypothetical protein
MPSPAYNHLLSLVSLYVDSKKAAEVLARQLTACKLTADTIASADIKANASRFTTACGLYIADSVKREELKERLMAL